MCQACRIFCVPKERDHLLKLDSKIYCQCDMDYKCIFKNCPDYTDKDIISKNFKSILEFHNNVSEQNKKSNESKNNETKNERQFDFESR